MRSEIKIEVWTRRHRGVAYRGHSGGVEHRWMRSNRLVCVAVTLCCFVFVAVSTGCGLFRARASKPSPTQRAPSLSLLHPCPTCLSLHQRTVTRTRSLTGGDTLSAPTGDASPTSPSFFLVQEISLAGDFAPFLIPAIKPAVPFHTGAYKTPRDPPPFPPTLHSSPCPKAAAFRRRSAAVTAAVSSISGELLPPTISNCSPRLPHSVALLLTPFSVFLALQDDARTQTPEHHSQRRLRRAIQANPDISPYPRPSARPRLTPPHPEVSFPPSPALLKFFRPWRHRVHRIPAT